MDYLQAAGWKLIRNPATSLRIVNIPQAFADARQHHRAGRLAEAEALYREIFRLMESDAPEAAPLIHAAVARLIALAFIARQRQAGSHLPEVPAVLSRAVQRMKLYYFERQTLGGLATLSGMSESHFSRSFKAAFGTSPIDWLRRERINQAKLRLVETADAIKEIAEQVGYSDRFFFSKDFKQLTGQTPREFRQRETLRRGT